MGALDTRNCLRGLTDTAPTTILIFEAHPRKNQRK